MADETENNENLPAADGASEPNATPEVEASAADEAVAEPVADGAEGASDATGGGEAEGAPAVEAPEPVAPATPKERKAATRARRGTRRGATPEERAEVRKAKAAARRRRRLQERERRVAKRAETGPSAATPPAEHGEGRPKTRTGTVTSNKADKTITVRVDVARRHRKYEKIVRSSSTLHAHDETNDANTGDVVRVVESRPLSATKRWKLVEVLERAK